MAEFLAITFDGTDDAEAALRSIRLVEKEGRIGLEDTAVVRKDAEGKVTIHNEMASGTEAGAVVGAVLGGLLFVVFPVAAVVGGAVAGGLVGRAAAPGIDGGFVKEVGGDLPAGGSALFLQVKRGGDTGVLAGALRQYHGRVRQTSYDEDVEQALDESLS
jgi:uncharacterized membrane protein